ncbi:RUN and FYVE domain-containing protein 4 [Eptesicus fuscus]|uniref:RUN and FYVE domain-containing protein 4 n=1 Tax=Eptesicus fuscus TaxID=29078 RepID=UPI0024040478|nr:RUN and FYVE domain-containing protein 4 [Eptesicus fuscus]
MCLLSMLGHRFDQKQQKSFLRPQKDYWDFLCTALRQQRGNTEPALFVHSQDKLKTPLGKGRAFIRFCLAHGQLAEYLQLCLLNPELTREWYGPRSPLVCPELQEDILDSLYALNGVAFDLDLQRPDLDGAWPMFSESRCSNSSRTQGRPRKTKDSPKEISAVNGGLKGVQPEEAHTSQASCLRDAPGEDQLAGLPMSQQHRHLPPFLEKKKEDPRSLGGPHSMWEPEREKPQQDQEMGAPQTGICLEHSTPSIPGLRERANWALKEVVGTEGEGQGVMLSTEGQRTTEGSHEREAEWGHDQGLLVSSPRGTNEGSMSRNRQENKEPSILGEPSVLQGLGTKEGSATEKPQEQTGVTSVTRKEEQAEVALQDVVKTLRHRLQKTKEQAGHQEQLLKEQERELKAMQEQLSRCQEERASLQAALEQRQQEAERRNAMYEEELAGQRDLIHDMKRRVLELIQEKDNLWQKVQQLSSVTPGCCVSCSKLFRRLSRRYPCRLCGGLVCHACSLDYKKQERRCPPCAQKGEAQVV